MRAPLVTAGENLNIPVFSLMKSVEGFFIEDWIISGSSACGAEIPLEQRDLINNLVNLLIHNGIKCFSLMSTCAIAFILLNKYRTRVSMEKLLEEMIELKNELIRRKR
ncbi:unnamed protein product [Allacma fusca]|uniref:Uncharacterized protein n=1 Tax=Allacma fusca TaxID=39272 RepID=A0A8J2JWN5_9HEXA|nr:unnamed protein product [Allacma fusca]